MEQLIYFFGHFDWESVCSAFRETPFFLLPSHYFSRLQSYKKGKTKTGKRIVSDISSSCSRLNVVSYAAVICVVTQSSLLGVGLVARIA